ncbi:MAG: HDOD domain-containing protein [Desulfobacterales bacterium]|nr:HDOD domain-containing protein [Desulfobacterales bacterium]
MQSHLQILINDLVDGFPTLPAVVTQVMAITADADSSTKDLYRVIQADQALTVNVLKMANSVFYGLPKRIGSLQHALTILGYVEVRNLVIMQAVFKSFKVVGGKGPMDIRPFWEHALTCALAAELIGRAAGPGDQDLYVAGLVHDIGKLVIYMALPEAYAELILEVGPYAPTMFAMEQRFFGMTHAETAQRVLRQWMFPESILEAVGCHHHPENATFHSAVAWVVHAADLLVRWDYALVQGAEPEAATLRRQLLAPDLTSALSAAAWGPATLESLRSQLTAKKAQQADLLAMFTI